MDFTFKECLAITFVRSDKKITRIQRVQSQLIVLIKDLYGKFNIRLIVVSYSLRLDTSNILWLSLHLDPIRIIRWGCACIIILSYDYEMRFKEKMMERQVIFICSLVASRTNVVRKHKCLEGHMDITSQSCHPSNWRLFLRHQLFFFKFLLITIVSPYPVPNDTSL